MWRKCWCGTNGGCENGRKNHTEGLISNLWKT